MNATQLYVKRLLDILFSSIGILLLLPVYILIILFLKNNTHGGVLLSQEYIGKNGKAFMKHKFRTTDETPNSELTLRADTENITSTPLLKSLRKYHLDELPQLWNILKGDMSFVGPRPERQFFIDKIKEHSSDYNLVLQIKPGITSEASMYNGNQDTIESMLKRIDLDIRYLENRTLWFDFTIILDTIYSMIFNKKQYNNN